MSRLRGEDGQTLVEYALILLIVFVAAIGTVALLGQQIVALIPRSIP